MIPRTLAHRPPSWQQLLASGVKDVDELLAYLKLGIEDLRGPWAPRESGIEARAEPETAGSDLRSIRSRAEQAIRQFPVRIPWSFVHRMRSGDPEDPLLLQVLPTAEEQSQPSGFLDDPLGENQALAAPGLLRKYRSRALLMVTGACAVHCRYCFRRHYPYGENGGETESFDGALQHLASDPRIDEIILSGGDPLAASDRRLRELVQRLGAIPSLQRLRIHTRLPVVLPERIGDDLMSWLTASRLRPVMVIHANHARELSPEVGDAMARLRAAGVTVLNQSVLLAKINDSVAALEALSLRLFDLGVMPYYLHLLDRVQGAAHFEVAEDRARRLMQQLSTRLPGYLLPRLVREEKGRSAKTPIPWRPAESPLPAPREVASELPTEVSQSGARERST
ncbi:MAG: EF-P beta-lysylation protein EpmB [Acidobacteriota bacterium]